MVMNDAMASSTDSSLSYHTVPTASSDKAIEIIEQSPSSTLQQQHPRPSTKPRQIPLPVESDIPKEFVRFNAVAYDWTKELSESRIKNDEHPSMPLASSKDLAVLGSTLRMKMWLPSHPDPKQSTQRQKRGKNSAGGKTNGKSDALCLPSTKAIVKDSSNPEDLAKARFAMNNEFSQSESPFYSAVSYRDAKDSLDEGEELVIGGIEVYVAVVQEDGQKAILLPRDHVTMHVNKLYVLRRTETIIAVPRGRRGTKARIVLADKGDVSDVKGVGEARQLERFVLESQQQLRKLENQVKQHNNDIKRAQNLEKWREDYESVRQLWQCSKTTGPVAHFLAIDTEAWDQDTRDKDIIIEVGWSLVVPQETEESGYKQETTHFLVQESYDDNLRNGKYVPDNRKRFLFGHEAGLGDDTPGEAAPWNPCTRIAELAEVGTILSRTIEELRERGPVFIVFHSAGGDLGVLETLQVNSTHWNFSISGQELIDLDSCRDIDREEDGEKSSDTSSSGIGPTVANLIQPEKRTQTAQGTPLHDVRVIDTQKLFAALQVGDNMNQIGLKNLCLALEVNDSQIEATHNAANDAHYTAMALAAMASGPAVEEMREKVATSLSGQNTVSKREERRLDKGKPTKSNVKAMAAERTEEVKGNENGKDNEEEAAEEDTHTEAGKGETKEKVKTTRRYRQAPTSWD